MEYKTLITQEMLKNNILASNSVFICIDHKSEIIDEYIDHLSPVFSTISECEDGRSVDELLDGPVCNSGFNRLN